MINMLVTENETVERMASALEHSLHGSLNNDYQQQRGYIDPWVVSIKIKPTTKIFRRGAKKYKYTSPSGVATGVMLTENGFFTTSAHVAETIQVRYREIVNQNLRNKNVFGEAMLDEFSQVAAIVLPDGTEYVVDVTYYERHPLTDLALLKAMTEGKTVGLQLPIRMDPAIPRERVTMLAEGSRNRIIHPETSSLYRESGYVLKTGVDENIEKVTTSSQTENSPVFRDKEALRVRNGFSTTVNATQGDSGAPFLSETGELLGLVSAGRGIVAKTGIVEPIDPETTNWSLGATGEDLYSLVHLAAYRLRRSGDRIAARRDS